MIWTTFIDSNLNVKGVYEGDEWVFASVPCPASLDIDGVMDYFLGNIEVDSEYLDTNPKNYNRYDELKAEMDKWNEANKDKLSFFQEDRTRKINVQRYLEVSK